MNPNPSPNSDQNRVPAHDPLIGFDLNLGLDQEQEELEHQQEQQKKPNSQLNQTIKTKTIAVIAALSLLPAVGFAQPPGVPPVPPSAPIPHVPTVSPKDRDRDHDKGPKVPVTFLGVETSEVPRVVSEQLGLARGFGLVVDYVVPDGPAAAAGLVQNDILKMFNDQILMQPDQLAKLVRSYQEGT